MLVHGYVFSDAAFVIQWHILAMFAPSFFTGHLIACFSATRIIAAGALSILLCVAINLTGVSMGHFIAALVFLGIGWNFMFVVAQPAGSGLYRPREGRGSGLQRPCRVLRGYCGVPGVGSDRKRDRLVGR